MLNTCYGGGLGPVGNRHPPPRPETLGWSPGASPAVQGQDLHGAHSPCNCGRQSVCGGQAHRGHAMLRPTLAPTHLSDAPAPEVQKKTRSRKPTGSPGCASHDRVQARDGAIGWDHRTEGFLSWRHLKRPHEGCHVQTLGFICTLI